MLISCDRNLRRSGKQPFLTLFLQLPLCRGFFGRDVEYSAKNGVTRVLPMCRWVVGCFAVLYARPSLSAVDLW